MKAQLLIVVALAAVLAVACDGGDTDQKPPTPTAAEGMAAFAVMVSPTSSPSPTAAAGPTASIEPSARLRWRFEAGAKVDSTPAVAGGVVYVIANDHLYAVDAATGRERWRIETGSSDLTSPAVLGQTVYVAGGYDGYLYAVDAETGHERWRFKISGSATSPAVADGVVSVVGQDDHLYAIDAGTGQELWRWKIEDSFTSSPPTVGEGKVYVFGGTISGDLEEGHVYALDAATGQERWRFKLDNATASQPAIAGGVVYVGSYDEYVYALDAATGQEIWRTRTGTIALSSPAINDNTVYIGSMSGQVFALDAATGETRWRFSTGSWIVSSPAVVNGILYIGSMDKYIYALDAATGAESWRLETGDAVGSSPAVADSVVYVGSEDGYLYAINASGNDEFTGRRPDIDCTVPDDIQSYRFTVVTKMDIPELNDEIREARRLLEEGQEGGENQPSEEPGLDLEPGVFMLALFADMRMEGAFQAPDRAELRANLGDQELRAIGVGEKNWVKYGSMDWEESSEDVAGFDMLGDVCLGFSFPDVTGFDAEEETVNGVPALHYNLDQSDLPQLLDNILGEGPFAPAETVGLLDKVVVDLWLAKEGNWPVRMEAEARGTDDQGNQASLSMFMEVKDLNDPDIKIEPPIDSP